MVCLLLNTVASLYHFNLSPRGYAARSETINIKQFVSQTMIARFQTRPKETRRKWEQQEIKYFRQLITQGKKMKKKETQKTRNDERYEND